MDFEWKRAEKLFCSLDDPDCGEKEEWMRWYKEAWSHLAANGLTKVTDPLDDTRVRLRILALGWLVHDFCAACSDQYDSGGPYWSEWIKSLGIDPLWAVLTIDDLNATRKEFVESEMLSPDKVDDPVSSLEDDDDQDADFMDVEEINSELVPCLVMRAARQRRDELIEALVKGYGSTSALFVQMYICCADIRDLTFNRKMDLEERIDELEAEIEESSDASQIAEWQNEVHELRQQMEPDALRSAVLAGIMDEAFGPVDFLYDMDSPRWLGFHWFDQGCQVMLFGTPEVS